MASVACRCGRGRFSVVPLFAGDVAVVKLMTPAYDACDLNPQVPQGLSGFDRPSHQVPNDGARHDRT
jgi:hypothetical protein